MATGTSAFSFPWKRGISPIISSNWPLFVIYTIDVELLELDMDIKLELLYLFLRKQNLTGLSVVLWVIECTGHAHFLIKMCSMIQNGSFTVRSILTLKSNI